MWLSVCVFRRWLCVCVWFCVYVFVSLFVCVPACVFACFCFFSRAFV